MADTIFANDTVVKGISALFGDRFQAVRQLWLAVQVTNFRRPSARHKDAFGGWAIRQLLGIGGPIQGDSRRHRIAVLGKADCRLQQLSKILAAVIVQ